jgi:hypothetical protein
MVTVAATRAGVPEDVGGIDEVLNVVSVEQSEELFEVAW